MKTLSGQIRLVAFENFELKIRQKVGIIGSFHNISLSEIQLNRRNQKLFYLRVIETYNTVNSDLDRRTPIWSFGERQVAES